MNIHTDVRVPLFASEPAQVRLGPHATRSLRARKGSTYTIVDNDNNNNDNDNNGNSTNGNDDDDDSSNNDILAGEIERRPTFLFS